MLYALRYQKTQTSNIASLITLLLDNGVSAEDAKLVYVLLNVAGADQRQDDLFSTESLLAKGRSALKGLKVHPICCLSIIVSDLHNRALRMFTCNIARIYHKRWKTCSGVA